MIEMEFDVVKSKVLSTVKLKTQGRWTAIPHGMIVDTGATMTTMSKELFNALGYQHKDVGNIKIIGINGTSKGISTVIDYFEIGGVNIGPVRIAVGELTPEFRNSIILGMNIMLWYDFAMSHFSNKITLVER